MTGVEGSAVNRIVDGSAARIVGTRWTAFSTPELTVLLGALVEAGWSAEDHSAPPWAGPERKLGGELLAALKARDEPAMWADVKDEAERMLAEAGGTDG